MKPNDEVKLTVQQIRDAAKSCSAAKRVLKKMFPAVFDKEKEYFHFGESFLITENPSSNKPFFIGQGLAKDNDVQKVLILDPRWELVVVRDYNDDQTGLLFKKK